VTVGSDGRPLTVSSPAASPETRPGSWIVRADAVGTVLFVATATWAAIAFTTAAQWVGAVTAMSLFAVGVAAFLVSFFHAVGRSREDEIAVTQLYLLVGAPTPPRVRWPMLALLAVQCVAALVTALARPNGPDGNPGSSLAVGFLVPMFGIAMNGLWAARHGRFPPRLDPHERRAAVEDDEPTTIGKNGDHG
jgi:hypothetical protein